MNIKTHRSVCANCKKEIMVHTHQVKFKRNYCSRKCMGVGSRTGEHVGCEECGKTFYRPGFAIKSGKGRFCSRKCHGALMRGELGVNWRGGKSHEIYTDKFTKELKLFIRDREDFECLVCGMHELENGNKLEIHHIDYVKENSTKENLVALCKTCHSRTNFFREYWQSFFTQVMYEN